MIYEEYRIDFHGKRAIFNSITREVVVISLAREWETELTPQEETGLVYHILRREVEELEGRVNTEVRTMDGVVSGTFIQWEYDFTPRRLRELEYIRSNYDLGMITIKSPRREILELTPIPEGSMYLPNDQFNKLISDWVEGKFKEKTIPYEIEV